MFETKLTLDKNACDGIQNKLYKLEYKIRLLGGDTKRENAFGRSALYIKCNCNIKEKVVSLIKDSLVGIYCKTYKREYVVKNLSCIRITNYEKRETLISALTVFDREMDEELVRSRLSIRSEFAIDAFFTFRLGELISKWENAIKIANDNVGLLFDESNFYLFIKFLLSTAMPKSETVRICKTSKGYMLKPNFLPPLNFTLSEQKKMFSALIDIAPMFVQVVDEASKNSLIQGIKGMFDVKSKNKLLIFGENVY